MSYAQNIPSMVPAKLLIMVFVVCNKISETCVPSSIELEPQSALSKAKKFVRLRFVNSEVAKRLDGIQNRPVRRILKAIALSVCGLNSFPEVMRLSQGCFGVSQWIHLRKV